MRQHHRLRRGVSSLFWLLLALTIAHPAVAQNFLTGPFRLNLGFTAGADFRDNANLSENHPKADVLLSVGPTLSGGVFLPFSGGEEFTLSVAATYSHSLTGAQSDDFGAPLNASLVLPLYVAEWNVVLADSFNFENDPLDSTFAVNRTRVTEYANIASASATHQLGKFSATFAAQRTDDFYPSDPSQEETDYLFSFTPAYFFREGYSVFIRNSYGISYLVDPTLRDSRGYSTQLGLNGQITPSLNGTVSLGWSHLELNATPTNGIDHIDGVSSQIAVNYTHPLRPNTTHTLSFFHDPGITLGLKESSITAVTGVNYTIAHRLSRYLTLAPNVGWTHLESLSGSREIADITVVGFRLQRQFTKKLTGSFAYQYQTRNSNLVGQSYDVNEVTVNFNYTF
jgi:Putative beta-barrel porin 2